MNYTRFAAVLILWIAPAKAKDDIPPLAHIEFRVAPSPKSPWIKTPGGGYRAKGEPPDPADVALTISVQGSQLFGLMVHDIEIDPEALPEGVVWTESQGSANEDGCVMVHYFHITRARPFRLRREDFRELPNWLKLPKLVLQQREATKSGPLPSPTPLQTP